MDWLKKTIDDSTQFGTVSSRKSIVSFVIKIFLFLLPAIAISHILDETMNRIYNRLGSNSAQWLLLFIHILLMIFILYTILVLFENYHQEFQSTTAGGFFIALFFGFQPYFLKHLKDHMRSIY